MFGFATPTIPSFGDLAWHRPVTDVAYAALSANTLAPAAGVSAGQTLTKNTNGALGAEPIASTAGVAVGDRLLVTSEASPKNGIWVVTSLGGASSKWVLTRATDMDTVAEGPVGSIAYDLAIGGLWVAVGGGSGAWTLSPTQVGALFLGLPADVELRRSAAKTLELSDAAGGAAALSILGALSVGGSVAGIGDTTLSGTSVPTINNGGTATFSGRACAWVAIGPLVVFRFGWTVTANGSGATVVTVTGTSLPTTAAEFYIVGSRSGVGVQSLVARMQNSGGELTLTSMATVAASTTALTGANLLNASGYNWAGVYLRT